MNARQRQQLKRRLARAVGDYNGLTDRQLRAHVDGIAVEVERGRDAGVVAWRRR